MSTSATVYRKAVTQYILAPIITLTFATGAFATPSSVATPAPVATPVPNASATPKPTATPAPSPTPVPTPPPVMKIEIIEELRLYVKQNNVLAAKESVPPGTVLVIPLNYNLTNSNFIDTNGASKRSSTG